ncbi:hypothetical protein [Herbihabitans rhizosphaerae]|nr:hypothetical protein [Herbihabitans rhizosphaerae]
MATELPILISFELPEGWQPVSPDEVGAEGAAFVALNLATQGSGFTANITIDGDRRPDATLADLADASARDLAAATQETTVVNREEVGGPEAPGLTQLLRLTTPVNDVVLELVQSQVYLAMPGAVVIRAILTSTEDQFATVVPDFQKFVSTLQPDIGD